MKKNNKGFTLVELLAVIVILGLLMAIAIPSVTRYITQSRVKTLVSTVESYVTAVVTQINDGEYKFSDSSKVFAIPIECISLEKGGTDPFGNWMQANEAYWAYVLVHYDSENYNYEYGFTFKDDAGYGLYPTINDKITNSMVRTGYDDLTQPGDGLAKDFVSLDKWEGFANITDSTELVVLESTLEGETGDGYNTCTLCQKGDNYDDVNKGDLEKLQEKYDFNYYSSLNDAVNDINGNVIGNNADATKDTGNVGVYVDESGKAGVILLSDITISTRVTPTTDVTINLGGKVLTCTDKIAIDTSKDSPATITINGRIEGSTIEIYQSDASTARPIQAKTGSTVIVLGGTYIGSSNGANASVIYAAAGATLNVSDATIIANETVGTTRGFSINAGANAYISNCTITAKAEGATTGKSYGIYNSGSTIVTGCTITAMSNYIAGYAASSQGILNYYNADLTLNNCYVRGTHSGVQNAGTLNVNGGTYEGYGHGGFYFSGEGTVSHIRNAVIRECDMPSGYTATSADNNAGFYVGGNNNVKVYVDNSDIYGSEQCFAIRSSTGEENNAVYISNSRVNTNATVGIRIDGDTHRLYIGVGNNFTSSNTTNPSSVVVTSETYK